MTYSLSIKMIMAVTLLMILILQQTYAYDTEDEAFKKFLEEHPGWEEALAEAEREREKIGEPLCPPEYMDLYKECKGTLKTCSQCLSDAERDCDRAMTEAKANGVIVDGTCSACTTNFNGRCDSAERMCFGYQECGGRDLHCINFKCEYDT